MLENSPPASTEDWDRSHGFPWRHKSRQGHAKNVMQLQNQYLKCPVFGEQWILLFSKSKMAPWKIGPIRSRIKNSRWRCPQKSAMLENSPPASTEDWDWSHVFPWRHKSRQGHAKNVVQLQNRYLQCPLVLNDRSPTSGHDEDWATWVRGTYIPFYSFQSILGRWPHREPILDLPHCLRGRRGKNRGEGVLSVPSIVGRWPHREPILDLPHCLRGRRGKNRGEGVLPVPSIVGRWPHREPILDLSDSLLGRRDKIGIRGYSLLVCYIKPSHVL